MAEAVKMTKKRSLIKQMFEIDTLIELYKITMLNTDNNRKGEYVYKLLRKKNIPFEELGPGTNRLGILIDGYAVKIALDKHGFIDNRREMLYGKVLQPYVIKVYESCIGKRGAGLVMVCEYVEIFSIDDYAIYKDKMKEILEIIGDKFMMGDVGITSKNYLNWGIRPDGTICILDFAYIYDVKYGLFVCTCDNETLLRYDKNFVNFICPKCGKKFTFGEIRKRITRKQQEEEIGDIARLGYIISKPIEEVPLIAKFEAVANYVKTKVKKFSIKKLAKNFKKSIKMENDWDDEFTEQEKEEMNKEKEN